jgi:DNA-directed RNA polymerase specialized sigma24 family protein
LATPITASATVAKTTSAVSSKAMAPPSVAAATRARKVSISRNPSKRYARHPPISLLRLASIADLAATRTRGRELARDVADQVAARIQHAQHLEDLATNKPNDRRALYLKGLGYRYREIMQITGASYTAVNRRISEGRLALRRLEHAREPPNDPEPATSGPDAAPPA